MLLGANISMTIRSSREYGFITRVKWYYIYGPHIQEIVIYICENGQFFTWNYPFLDNL